jgi:hypothetical protein
MDFRVILFGLGATIGGFYFWRAGARASSLIRGTATGKIATAAKGYAEVQGRARAPPTGLLRDPIQHSSCVWFAVVTEEFSILDKFRWKHVKSAKSSIPFVIEDDSGRCLVSPEEVTMDQRGEGEIVKERWDLRHRLWWIREGDPIFAIGFLQRLSDHAANSVANEARLAGATAVEHDVVDEEQVVTKRATELLRSWKQKPDKLMKAFDANRDGKIDSDEWEVARAAARDAAADQLGLPGEAGRKVIELARAGTDITHRLSQPPDGRPFLLTTHGEASLVSSHRRTSFWGLLAFIVGVIILLSLLRTCVGE